MKHPLERTSDEAQKICKDISSDLRLVKDNVRQIGDEYLRVTRLSNQAATVIDKIDRDFKTQTKLNNTDMLFLFLATAIQCARQYLLTNDKLRLTAKQGDRLIEEVLTPIIPPSYEEVLFQSVPYDAISIGNLVSESTGLSGATHRYRTLGHDPILGWIFGTANIMTHSLTKYNLETYQVSNMVIIRHYPNGTMGMFDRFIQYAQSDPLLLSTAVARQAIHFGSDYFTKQGLPVPLVASIDNNLAKNMIMKGKIDMWSIMRGATLATLINHLVASTHRLLYCEEKDGSPTTYEIRTRKILSYSNALATGSNVIITAFTQDSSKLDVGGMLVTLYRLISDYKFIHEIKKDFLKNELQNRIIGSEYDFMKGAYQHE